ncbi:hypothetical protein MHH60_17335 [Paenibacillus sp. FSL H7-0716]|nr:hypothetical protein [Paenibacillus odorifer]
MQKKSQKEHQQAEVARMMSLFDLVNISAKADHSISWLEELIKRIQQGGI